MLDISLKWGEAKDQCGEGHEQRHLIQPNDDVVLGAAAWKAYQRRFPNVHYDPRLFIPFLQGTELSADILETEIGDLQHDPKELEEGRLLLAAFDRRLADISPLSTETDEILLNAFLQAVRHNLTTTILYYRGKYGQAFAAENKSKGPSHQEILRMVPKGNEGKGFPLLTSHKALRIGTESNGAFRVMAVQTPADRKRVFLRYAVDHSSPNDGKGRFSVDGLTVWNTDVVPYFSRLMSSPTINNRATSYFTDEETASQETVLQHYRSLAWQRIHETLGF